MKFERQGVNIHLKIIHRIYLHLNKLLHHFDEVIIRPKVIAHFVEFEFELILEKA